MKPRTLRGTVMTPDTDTPERPERSEPPARTGGGIVLARCHRCPMRVRNDEMDIHLAHAHNIGPNTGKKDKGGRDRNRRSR